MLLSRYSKMVFILQLRFSKTFFYENCQILIINWRWGLAGSLFNSKPAVTEVTYPWLTHWGEDNYGCHFSEIIKIPHLSSITPQGYQITKTNVFLHLVIQKPLVIILQKLVFFYENCYIFIVISYWDQKKLFTICRCIFKLIFNCVTIVVLWL